MASFVANHRKKIESLHRKEEALRRLIDRGADAEKLLLAALEVREARIRVVKVKWYSDPVSCVEQAVNDKIEEKIEVLRSLSAESVLAEYLPRKSANSNWPTAHD